MVVHSYCVHFSSNIGVVVMCLRQQHKDHLDFSQSYITAVTLLAVAEYPVDGRFLLFVALLPNSSTRCIIGIMPQPCLFDHSDYVMDHRCLISSSYSAKGPKNAITITKAASAPRRTQSIVTLLFDTGAFFQRHDPNPNPTKSRPRIPAKD